MGLIKKVLSKTELPDREAHNSRLFVDLCENIHIHFRELRIVFSLPEYFEFADIISRSTEDVKSYLAQNPDYIEKKFPTTIMIAGGKERQKKLLQNSPMPNKSYYSPNDFSIELQDESVIDEIHVHWRDYRFSMPREHLHLIADQFLTAKKELEEFEKHNEYYRKSHRNRNVEDLVNERESLKNYENRIMGEIDLDINSIIPRWEKDDKRITRNRKYLEELAKRYKEGERQTPIILSTEKNGSLKIIDGSHRCYAAAQAGLKKINCIIMDITFDQSELFRKAESLLKEFDQLTGGKYNTHGFNKEFLAYRASGYYRNHYTKLINEGYFSKRKIKFRFKRMSGYLRTKYSYFKKLLK